MKPKKRQIQPIVSEGRLVGAWGQDKVVTDGKGAQKEFFFEWVRIFYTLVIVVITWV